MDSAYGTSNVPIFAPEACFGTAGSTPGTAPGWLPDTLFGIGTNVLLVGVVPAIVFILILAVWRRRRRESEREDESDETPTELSEDRRDRDPLALQWKESSNAET